MSVSLTPSLTALPTELLTIIMTNIASKPTLCNLARCSRQLYLCTIPHLYSHITIEEDKNQKDERLVMLTTSLLRRPDLAELVRQFSLHVMQPSGIRTVDYIGPEYVRNDENKLASAVSPLGLSQEEVIDCLGQYDHGHNIHQSHHDFILSFLLPSMLNVEKLVLDVQVGAQSPFLKEAIRKAVARESLSDTHPPFEALTVFVQSPHNYEYARELDFIASLLRLPAIQEISGDFTKLEEAPERYYDLGDFGEETFADSNLKELASFSSPLTSLDIAIYDVLAVDVRHILRVPVALKNLSLMLSSLYGINCEEIPHALEPQKHCLESITIYYDQNNMQPDVVGGFVFGHMEPFTLFSALKTLKIEGLMLTETVYGSHRQSLFSIFPSSLEILHITRFQPAFKKLLEALERLLAYKSSLQIPLLTTLILEETTRILEETPDNAPPARLKDVLWGDTQEFAIDKLGVTAESQNVFFEVIEDENYAGYDENEDEDDDEDEDENADEDADEDDNENADEDEDENTDEDENENADEDEDKDADEDEDADKDED
ncbi:hypothetical protein MMC22_004555 [Lobaria immixta]|nr:hypothetical protein [Lobaria immixta]